MSVWDSLFVEPPNYLGTQCSNLTALSFVSNGGGGGGVMSNNINLHWIASCLTLTFQQAPSIDRVSFRGRVKGSNCPPWIFCAPLGFKILNDLPVYGQLVTLTIGSNLAAPP